MPPLPVELCQAILRHSIYVPGLFDPDAFEGDLMAFGFGHPGWDRQAEKSYRRGEKIRKNMRRVCWAWNEYLTGFEHRLVSMSDVMHGRVDKMFLKKAIRISFDRGGCSCTKVCVVPSLDDKTGRAHVGTRFVMFCNETIRPFGFLPAEIVDIDDRIISYVHTSEVMRLLKRAKVLVSWRFKTIDSHPPLLTQTDNVAHIHGYIWQNDHLGLSMTAPNLVTVSLLLDERRSGEMVVLELPSLRHLRINYGRTIPSSEYFGTVLMALLEQVGGQLRSLYINISFYTYQMPVEVWDICPNLERFHPGMVLAVSPPLSHPIHTLSVRPNQLLPAATLQFPNLRRLILDGKWKEIGSQGVTDLVSIRMTSLIDRVTVEDLDGVPLADAPEDTDTALTRKSASIQL